MPNNVTETILGAVVLVAAAGFVVYAGKVTGNEVGTGTYSLSAEFRSVQGVSVGTDVRMAGIKVGSVAGLELDFDSYFAVADLNIRSELLVPEDSDVKIASEGLLGGSFVEITPGASEFMLDDGDEILNTQSSVDLINLLMRFGTGE